MTQVCAQRHKVATEGILFPSKSSDKVYKVTAFRPNEFPFCSCPSYIFSRSKIAKQEGVHQNTIPGSCKHLQAVLGSACDWRQETEEQYRFDDICPKCGGPLVEEGDYAIPEDPVHAVDDLRSLLAEMSGEEAPAPLPKPKPFTVHYTRTVVQECTVHLEALDAAEAQQAFEAINPPELGAAGANVIVENETVVFTGADEQGSAPQAKRTRKPAAKKATARSRQADVTDLIQGAKR